MPHANNQTQTEGLKNFPDLRPAEVPRGVYIADITALRSWGYFYVGGEYETETENVEACEEQKGESLVMRGQVYVEVFVPRNVTRPYPLVFFSGNNVTGLSWLNTPDGRPGWAQYFWEKGYIVYLLDVPNRGRSSQLPKPGQRLYVPSAQCCETRFAGKGNPSAVQWPGTPCIGAPEFDAFYATIVPSLNDNVQMEQYAQKAAVELLDKIGPAVVAAHSQSGPFAWLTADARPKLVRGLLLVEPRGMPFHNSIRRGVPENAAWGLTEIPITYEPSVTDPENDLPKEIHIPKDERLQSGCLQKEPAKILVNLRDIPMLLLTGSASYHHRYDYLTVLFLKQAGVRDIRHVLLKDVGVEGNSHFMFLEKNNQNIAEIAFRWIEEISGRGNENNGNNC
jgi:pimeloyl-ACP methyl ester carboxylesterase